MKPRRKTMLKPGNVIPSVVLCLVICLAGIGYVWAKAQVYELGREMKTLENRLEDLKRTNAIMRQVSATLCSPGELDKAVRRLNLGLVAPRPDQIIRMQEPMPGQEKTYAAK